MRVLLAAALVITGCGACSLFHDQHLSAPQSSARQVADHDAQELLTQVRMPPSAKRVGSAPTSRLDAPFAKPDESTLVDRHTFWRVSMTVDAAASWLRAHPPAGLRLTQSGNGGGPAYQVVQFAYEPATARADRALRQLQVEVTNLDDSSSGLRADGLAEWLDPRPLRDTAAGRRLHVTVGGSCPRSVAGFVGVTNTGSDLASRLVPVGAPAAGRLCRYDGGNGDPAFRLLTERRLDAGEAGKLASAAGALRLSHPDRVATSCPNDDGAAAVVALRYGDRDVDLWVALAGCRFVSNGRIRAESDLPGLVA